MSRMFYPRTLDPYDKAVADFECALSPARLLETPADELVQALTLARRRTSELSTVYVIGNDANSLLKVGYADNLRTRFGGLNTGSPVTLRLVHFLHVVDGAIAIRVESETHKLLAEHRRKGEWFEVSLPDAAKALASVMITNKLRWWTEEERLRLAEAAKESAARYEERARFYGT